MKFALTMVDDSMPRTLFWERLLGSLKANRRFTANEADADVLFPAEDVAMEMNWPRYGRLDSAFIRGKVDQKAYDRYMNRLLTLQRPLCIINMYPFIRVPQIVRDRAIYVADICLADFERSLCPRSIAMPVPAITDGGGKVANKDLLAFFRGLDSHPCRRELAKLHNGRDFICELVPADAHVGKIDATTGQIDASYADLMGRTIFAMVPRGDSLFSYRLIEALSFGCIPVVLSDAWVLPFDRLIDWPAISVRFPEAQISKLPSLLKLFSPGRIGEMRGAALDVYRRHLAETDVMVESLLREIELQFSCASGST